MYAGPLRCSFLGCFMKKCLGVSAAIFMAGILATFISCGGGGDLGDVEPSGIGDSATPTFDSGAQAAAEGAVLNVDDLPSGWLEEEPSDEDSGDPCGTKELRSRETARAESMNFTKDNDQVSNTVSVYGSENEADQTVSDFVNRMKGCDPEAMLDQLSKASLPENVSVENAEIGRLSFSQLGDRTEAVRITVTFGMKQASGEETTFEVPYDYVLIRVGRMVSGVSVAEISFGSADLPDEMADLALAKLQNVAPMLNGADGDLTHGGGSETPLTRTAPTSTAVPSALAGGEFGQFEKIGAMRIAINSLERVEPQSYMQPDAGNEFIAFDVEACSDTDEGDINPFDFQVEMPDHTRRQSTFAGREPALHSTGLIAGDCVRGWVSFETPAGIRPSFIVYSGEYGTKPFKWVIP